MSNDTLNGVWDATAFFQMLTENNKLATSENFVFTRCSGLEGFEQALHQMQSASAIVAVSDIANGYMEMNNTPKTRRVKTVFLAMRHAVDDMEARSECMDIMRELFRQFMSVLTREAVKLENNYIFLDPRISFNEIEQYFFSGCACAYFQIAVDVFTDLQYNADEWAEDFVPETERNVPIPYKDIWLVSVDSTQKMAAIKLVRDLTGLGLKEAKEIVDDVPSLLFSDVTSYYYNEIRPQFNAINAVIEFR